MSPELKSAVQSDGYFIKLLNDVKQYNAVYVIPTGTVIPEGYIKVFEGSEGTVYRAFAEIKICVSADEQFLHIYPNINRGNTRLLLWFYISISENGEMQLIKWIEDYKGQETQKVFAF
jgi:hypothetical protein